MEIVEPQCEETKCPVVGWKGTINHSIHGSEGLGWLVYFDKPKGCGVGTTGHGKEYDVQCYFVKRSLKPWVEHI